jgi:predicted chitinase
MGVLKYFDKYDSGSLAKRLGNTQALDGDGFKYRGADYNNSMEYNYK